MKMFSYLLKTLVIGLAAATIPTDITFCDKEDPHLNDCMKSSIQKTIPKITNGVPEWGIPTIAPLYIPEIEMANQDKFMATIRNTSIYGLPNLKVKMIDVQLDKRYLTGEILVPGINVTGEYNGKTTILVPLEGKGPVTVVAKNISATLRIDFDTVRREGDTFVYLKKATAKVVIGEFDFHFQSYENPGGPLDEGINTAVNGDPKSALNAVTPAIEKVIATYTLEIGNKFCKQYPYDYIFPIRKRID